MPVAPSFLRADDLGNYGNLSSSVSTIQDGAKLRDIQRTFC